MSNDNIATNQSSPFLVEQENGKYTISEAASSEALYDIILGLLEKKFYRSDVMTSPQATKQFLLAKLAQRENEIFCCVFLDNRHRVIAFEELFQGTINGASIHGRIVLKRCLHHNAAAVIFAHNHPSSDPSPSSADIAITKRLTTALELIDVRVLDHIIIGGHQTVSLAERGLI